MSNRMLKIREKKPTDQTKLSVVFLSMQFLARKTNTANKVKPHNLNKKQ